MEYVIQIKKKKTEQEANGPQHLPEELWLLAK